MIQVICFGAFPPPCAIPIPPRLPHFPPLYTQSNGHEPNNIETGADCSIAELASLVRDVVGYGGGLRFDRSRPDGSGPGGSPDREAPP